MATKKSVSTGLSSWCSFKLLESHAGQFILAIFKYSTILVKKFPDVNELNLVCTTNLRHVYIEALYEVHMASFVKMDSIDREMMLMGLGRMTEVKRKS